MNLKPFTVMKVIRYARDENINNCKAGMRQLPVSLRETAIVETHCKAKIKNTINPIIVEDVKRLRPELSTLAFFIE
jgi:hypothetical protein